MSTVRQLVPRIGSSQAEATQSLAVALSEMLFNTLSDAIGQELRVDEATVSADSSALAVASERVVLGSSGQDSPLELLVRISVDIPTDEPPSIMALLFLLSEHGKIAPSGFDFIWYEMVFEDCDQAWICRGWAVDEYDGFDFS